MEDVGRPGATDVDSWQNFNPVFASIVSRIIRAYTWHRYRIYIDFQAIQVSLLAGRVFFTGLRYHGNNETILIQMGHVTWSYWLRRVRDASIVTPEKPSDGSTEKKSKLPCRISADVSGVQWFVYNRSAAYDAMLEAMTVSSNVDNSIIDEKEDLGTGSTKPRQRMPRFSEDLGSKRHSEDGLEGEKPSIRGDYKGRPPSASESDSAEETRHEEQELPLMLQLLPIHFKADKAALVMGNENTRAVFVAKAASVSGEMDAASSPTPDPYRQLFKINLEHPVVEMRENEVYKEDQFSRAAKDRQVASDSGLAQYRPFFRRQRRKMVGQLRNLVPYWRTSVESFSVDSRNGDRAAEAHIPGSNRWQGLTRYLNDDDEDDKLRWSSVEYAAVHTVVDCPDATLTLLWDVPGKVSQSHRANVPSGDNGMRNYINGAVAPAWDINIALRGGVVNYGPWADRQRAELQRVFFPGLCKDATPAEKLPVGADRVPTVFNFYIELEEEVVVRVPTREDSKNWKWKKEAAALKQHHKQEQGRDQGRERQSTATNTATQQRPYGWLDIKIGANATVSYSMDMLAGLAGYSNTLKIELPATEVSTSVNHGVLWKSGAQRISGDLSSPLKWNGFRNWRFAIDSDELELFILRDHIFLLTDLIDDWGSGPPQDYLLFTPFKYHLELKLQKLKLYLNVNDANIVNNPTDLADNTFIILSSPCLTAGTCISLDSYRPAKSAIPLDIRAESLSISLHVPPWNTQASFLTSTDIGRLESLVADGSYHYNSTTSSANTDTLVLNVTGQSPTVYLYGFLVRYFLQLKDNYFGDYVHFRTLDEYQETLRAEAHDPGSAAANRPPHKKSNDLDIMLSIRADDPRILLPANLYSARRHIQIETPTLSTDLRFTNYYMDLDLCISPLSLSSGSDDGGTSTPISAASSTQLFVDGLNIYGHRLFGLPPTEPTYLCNWDLSVGAVTGECSADFLMTLVRGGKAFGFSFDDDENALIPSSAVVVYDATFLRVFVQSVQVWLHVEEAAFLFSAGPIEVNYNDWARTHYSKRAEINLPDLEIACVNSESASSHRAKPSSRAQTDALLRTSIRFALVGRKHDFVQARKLQQELIRHHDQRTRRAGFLLLPGLLGEHVPDQVDPPAQSVPPVPQPALPSAIVDEDKSFSSVASSRRRTRLRKQTSFLSLAGSGDSIRSGTPSIYSARRHRPIGQTTSHSGTGKGREVRPAKAHREHHSIGHNPDTHATHGDARDRRDPLHTTVAFSSQYFPPYFPLDNARPDSRETTFQSVEHDEGSNASGSTTFVLDDIDPDLLSQDSAHQSFLLEFPTGISAFLNAPSLRHVASLLSTLQPTDPEDILDTLQVSAMTSIFDMQKRRAIKGHITEFLIRLPQANIRFLNCPDLDSSDVWQEEQDQYDVTLKSLALSARSQTSVEQSTGDYEPQNSRLSFNVRLASADISAAERSAGLDETQAAVVASVKDIMASLGTKEVAYLDVDIGSLSTVSSSGKIEYLASLIHRTSVLASEMGKLFSTTISNEDERLREFTYRVISEGQGASDPSFVVRPSAVLRAASDHLRTYDSWKLITRLRQMWFTLDRNTKEHISRDCLCCFFERPANAREQVMAAFERWRSWDLGNLAHTVLLDNIFGKSPDSAAPSIDRSPLMAVARVQEIQFVLDPGPKENQIFFVDLTVRLEEKPRGWENSRENSDIKGPLTIVNVFCSQAGVNLNWDLCRLADDILKLYNKRDTGVSPDDRAENHSEPPKTPKPQKPWSPRSFHVVTVLLLGSVRLETINVIAEAQSSDLKLSVLAINARPGMTTTNIILGCDETTTKIRSQSQSLVSFRLRSPSVFVGHGMSIVKEAEIHTVKATASSQAMRLLVKQDPVVLLEVVDTLVRDEAAQLYQLQQRVPSSTSPQTQNPKVAERLSTFRVNVAMFLDSYTITIPLLPSLTYTIRGVVSRAAMAANFGKEIIFDFDVKENSHEMQININNTPRSISLLQIPPTNGRVTSRMTPGEHAIIVFASVELVQLDASAVYSLLAALNRPEISNTLGDLKQQGKVIKEHANEIFGSSGTVEPASPKRNDSNITYVVHSTLAGIEIFSTTPLNSETDPQARLSFCLDSIHFELANKLEQGQILERPEVHVNLRKVKLDIEKGSPERMRSCGNLSISALITATSRESDDGTDLRAIDFESDGLEVNLSPETVSTSVDVLGYMSNKIKDLDTSRELEYLRKLRQSKPKIAINDKEEEPEKDIFDSFLSSIMYSFVIQNIQIAWLVSNSQEAIRGQEDLVLSFKRIELSTRRKKTAKLTIENLQLQMVPPGQERTQRSLNSALLPEVILNLAYVSTSKTRRLAFQAIGKTLDIRLTSAFIVPASHLQDSITLSTKNVRQVSEYWTPIVLPDKQPEKLAGQATETSRSILGSKRLESLLIDADFAGAVVHLSARKTADDTISTSPKLTRPTLAGKYGQFSTDEAGSSAVLRSPGLALKTEYRDDGREDATLYGEIKVDASRNILYPSVVPLILDITSSIKEVVSDDQAGSPITPTPSQASGKEEPNDNDGDNILTADPSAVLGRIKLNLGLRICKQEFTLSCQPIGRVAATACFEDIYITCNTVHSVEHGNFFAISGTFSNFRTAVQHVYSQGSTASFEVETLVLSLMNSKHVSGTSGVSAILKVSPMAVDINARQLQDFLLFREIWLPEDVRQSSTLPVEKATPDPATQAHLMQRYQQVAATAAFPWTASLSISGLDVSVDLGQSLGKSKFGIENLWLSSKKTSDWEQNLCLGFDRIGIDCTGRLGGFIALQDFKLRTSIEWPEREQALNETPRVQASIGFSEFRMKAAFDYQAFLVADIRSLNFLMYNVRQDRSANGDRLVAIFDGDAVQVFGTTSSAAQSVALWKAIQRLIQERKASFEASLRDIERFMRRKSSASQGQIRPPTIPSHKPSSDDPVTKSPISLDTDVVVTLRALNLGVFPNSFSDHQVFKLEALNAQARFAASMERRIRVHSILGLTLGQLRIGLAGVRQEPPRSASEISVEHVVASATGSRGGTILKVPKVEAVMQTWQQAAAAGKNDRGNDDSSSDAAKAKAAVSSRTIEYIFKSAFEGKVEVGWNYSRISFIRSMWATHSRALATTWGREIPAMSAIKVTGMGVGDQQKQQQQQQSKQEQDKQQQQQQKITAEVNVPQSKYEYVPLEPPVIETPQLRDMGEATPPLEWIGLHRDRLPNLTHQIVIVSLLELAGEVEEAYSKILGSS
ncbi:Macrophage colony-stimulating factor 1 receptor [Diatrype stigma]|uniref:Macrophage colony-stimulating factor 1 receptor n=1 Tax=Diatrype stigma TaxID=117547 RepID=A0AAN9YXB4_9PEZI